MSLSYQNDEKPDDFWAPLFLAYRDITGQAPIDKVAYPGVHITPACFPNNVYDGLVFQSCFSNLLSAQYRRFIIDVYWDVSSRDFTLCPAELPRQASNTSQETVSPPTTALASVVVPSASLAPRQQNRTVSISAPSNTTTEAATTTLSSAISTKTSETGSQLLQLGPYLCSDDLTLGSLFSILNGYIQATSDEVRGRFATLQFNLHAAAPPDDPDGLPETPTSSELPRGSERLDSQVNDNLGGYIYTPGDLARDRSNLNVSWFQVTTESRLPVTNYYDVTQKDDGVWETSNGWPSELFLVFNRFKMFLLTYGTISPEMQRYDFSEDVRHFFLANETTRLLDFEASAQGTVTSGCYYTESSTDVTRVNNTWARASIDALPQEPDQLLGNLTSCGLGPILNFTLNGTADESYQTYQAFAQAAIFGWAPGEPRNSSTLDRHRQACRPVPVCRHRLEQRISRFLACCQLSGEVPSCLPSWR